MNYWYIIAGSWRSIKTGLFFVFVALCVACMGQQQYNLVPNYSFENYNCCPVDVYTATYACKPDIWYEPDKRGATYLNTCANNNLTGVPVNFGGGGIAFNIQEQEMPIW